MVKMIFVFFCFFSIVDCLKSEDDNINDNEVIDKNYYYDMEEKADIKLPNVFAILQKFDLCMLSCKGKSCDCCHQFLNIVPVCGSIFVDPSEKTLEASLTVTGRKLFHILIPLDSLEHICRPVLIDIGEVELCVNTSFTEHKIHPESFRICMEAEIALDKVKYLHLVFNCIEFKGDIIFEGDESSETGKNIASVSIVNPWMLANAVRAIVTKGVFGG